MNLSLRSVHQFVLILLLLGIGTIDAGALRAPTPPLAERVKSAKVVALGKLVNKVVDGDWVRAEILVVEPVGNAKKGEKIPVIWRATLDDTPIYDAAEGTTGVVLLDDKHEGRYWLRDDKFENKDKLEEIKRILKGS